MGSSKPVGEWRSDAQWRGGARSRHRVAIRRQQSRGGPAELARWPGQGRVTGGRVHDARRRAAFDDRQRATAIRRRGRSATRSTSSTIRPIPTARICERRSPAGACGSASGARSRPCPPRSRWSRSCCASASGRRPLTVGRTSCCAGRLDELTSIQDSPQRAPRTQGNPGGLRRIRTRHG